MKRRQFIKSLTALTYLALPGLSSKLKIKSGAATAIPKIDPVIPLGTSLHPWGNLYCDGTWIDTKNYNAYHIQPDGSAIPIFDKLSDG